MKDKTPLNPINMSMKEWYRFLLETKMTKREVIEGDNMLELVPCKVEEKNPEVQWPMVYRCIRLKGISPDSKSFLFKLVHMLLPSRERLNHL